MITQQPRLTNSASANASLDTVSPPPTILAAYYHAIRCPGLLILSKIEAQQDGCTSFPLNYGQRRWSGVSILWMYYRSAKCVTNELHREMQTNGCLQTCRALRYILSRLPVWRTILLSVCDTYGLFVPSYPMDEMGIAELQLASLGPHRWRSLVKSKAVPLQRLDDAVPLPMKESSGELWHHWMAICLVPGGRYLAMINGSRSQRTLQLWDIGVPGKRPQTEPILLASTGIYPLASEYELFVCHHGPSLRIATSHMTEDDTQLYVSSLSHINCIEDA